MPGPNFRDAPPREPRPRGGRLLLPALPYPWLLPWVLAAVSAALLAYGLVSADTPSTTLGAVGLAAVIVAFPLARVLLGHHEDEPPPGPPSP